MKIRFVPLNDWSVVWSLTAGLSDLVIVWLIDWLTTSRLIDHALLMWWTTNRFTEYWLLDWLIEWQLTDWLIEKNCLIDYLTESYKFEINGRMIDWLMNIADQSTVQWGAWIRLCSLNDCLTDYHLNHPIKNYIYRVKIEITPCVGGVNNPQQFSYVASVCGWPKMQKQLLVIAIIVFVLVAVVAFIVVAVDCRNFALAWTCFAIRFTCWLLALIHLAVIIIGNVCVSHD